eukprot:14365568-Heterocapsa_arctica.AAC.1
MQRVRLVRMAAAAAAAVTNVMMSATMTTSAMSAALASAPELQGLLVQKPGSNLLCYTITRHKL